MRSAGCTGTKDWLDVKGHNGRGIYIRITEKGVSGLVLA